MFPLHTTIITRGLHATPHMEMTFGYWNEIHPHLPFELVDRVECMNIIALCISPTNVPTVSKQRYEPKQKKKMNTKINLIH